MFKLSQKYIDFIKDMDVDAEIIAYTHTNQNLYIGISATVIL